MSEGLFICERWLLMETSGSLGIVSNRNYNSDIGLKKVDVIKDLEKNPTIKRAFNILNEIKDSSIKYMC